VAPCNPSTTLPYSLSLVFEYPQNDGFGSGSRPAGISPSPVYDIDISDSSSFTNLVRQWRNQDLGIQETFVVTLIDIPSSYKGVLLYARARSVNSAGNGQWGDVTNVIICPPGQYFNLSTTECQDCVIGKYSTLLGAVDSSSCQLCPLGTYSKAVAATACTDCPPGKYGGVTGATVCATCAAGTYSMAGASSCEGGIEALLTQAQHTYANCSCDRSWREMDYGDAPGYHTGVRMLLMRTR